MFRLEAPRVVANDWVVRYRNRVLQLERHSPLPPARGTVLVSEDATGQIEIRYRERRHALDGAAIAAAARAPAGVPARLAARARCSRARHVAAAAGAIIRGLAARILR